MVVLRTYNEYTYFAEHILFQVYVRQEIKRFCGKKERCGIICGVQNALLAQ